MRRPWELADLVRGGVPAIAAGAATRGTSRCISGHRGGNRCSISVARYSEPMRAMFSRRVGSRARRSRWARYGIGHSPAPSRGPPSNRITTIRGIILAAAAGAVPGDRRAGESRRRSGMVGGGADPIASSSGAGVERRARRPRRAGPGVKFSRDADLIGFPLRVTGGDRRRLARGQCRAQGAAAPA